MKKPAGFTTIVALLLGLAAVAIIATGIVYTAERLGKDEPEQVACTADAKQCPDGSYVSRVPPSCEFAACPESTDNNQLSTANDNTNTPSDPTARWKTHTNASFGYSFKYPGDWTVNKQSDIEFEILDGNTARLSVETPPLGYGVAGTPTRKVVDGRNAIIRSVPGDINVQFEDAGLENIQIRLQYPTTLGADYPQLFDQILSTFTFTDQTAATKDWKTYTNTRYGWRLQYPPTWAIANDEDDNPQVELHFDEGLPGLQEFFTDERTDTLEEWRDKQKTQLPNAKLTVSEMTVGGVTAIRIDTNVYDNATYIGFRRGTVFVNVITSNALMITNGMLGTFRFTDQTSATKDWKTYTNAKHGFSFRYPPSWTISEDTTVDPTQIVYIAKDPTGAEGQLAVAPKGYPGSGAPDGTVTNRAIQFGTVQGTQITLTLPDKSIWISYVNLEQAAAPKGWEWAHPIHLSVGSKNSLEILNLILSTFTFTE
ncbi:MAG: hypothetical protein HYZ09_02320 [Candidatus Kerfeldbacteria bacterium]|nr:hypothetical protein [Candidatus Kerfeldbacteria bacterium]